MEAEMYDLLSDFFGTTPPREEIYFLFSIIIACLYVMKASFLVVVSCSMVLLWTKLVRVFGVEAMFDNGVESAAYPDLNRYCRNATIVYGLLCAVLIGWLAVWMF